jgi:glucokinase
MSHPFLGIEIGGTKLQVALGSTGGRIEQRRRLGVPPGADAADLRAQLEPAIRELARQADLRAVGAGFGGPTDWRAGRVAASHHVEGWDGFPLGDWLADVAGVPAAIDNDTNLGALAEAHRGAARGESPAAYVNFGSGMGGGLVVDGKLYHGLAPGEMEIGLARARPDGASFESLCSGWAVDARVRDEIRARPEGKLASLAGGATRGEARFLAPAIQQGDGGARAILEEVGGTIALALSHVCHLLNPGVIVLGGGLSLIGEPLRAVVAEALAGHLHPSYRPGPEVCLSQLGEDVVVVGALLLAERGDALRPA